MGVHSTILSSGFPSPKKTRSYFSKIRFGFQKTFLSIVFLLTLLPNVFSKNDHDLNMADGVEQVACDNATSGGEIAADEFGCPNPVWDPSPITSVSLPQGGTGTLEYIWIMTTDDPQSPGAFWNPIPGTNSPEYDPGPISVTTYYRRCARRSGCTDYIAESNIIVKEAICCDNVTDGGLIAASQAICNPPFTPNALTNVVLPTGGNTQVIEYQWASSPTNTPWSPSNPNWTFIAGANGVGYNPGTLTQTTYFVRLSRRHGCYDYDGVSNIVEIYVNTGITIDLNGEEEECLGAGNGSVTIININGGATPFTFQWTGFPSEMSGTLVGLSGGTFEVVVTDGYGCTASASYTMDDGPALTVNVSSTNVSCVGETDGTAEVTAVPDGIGTIQYLWNDVASQTTALATGLAPGSYQVTVTDSRGCTGWAGTFVNDAVPLVLNTFSTDATCGDETDGTASVEVTGGVTPYTYIWNDTAGQTTATAFNLGMGTYNVTVTDANGCSNSVDVMVDAPMQVELAVTTTDVLCAGSTTGAAQVAVVNGDINDFSVSWSNGQTTPTIVGLGAGTVGVTVTDANGCRAIASATIAEPTPIVLTNSASDASCFGGSDGTAEVMANGGTPFPNNVYQFVWDAMGSPNVPMLDDVSPGTYTVTVTDANGCTATATAVIGQPAQLQITLQSTNVSCNGLTDGSAFASATGGIAPYNFQWGNPINSNNPFVINLAPGAYSLSVTDANSCLATTILNISQPAPLTVGFNNVNVICTDDTNGVGVAIPSGGTTPYSILWETGQMTQAIFNLGVGSYDVTITDANSCTTTGTANIIPTTTLGSSVTVFDATCYNVGNGVAIVSGTNGTLPYTYLWSNGATTAQINDLFFGSYFVTVTDGDGCTVTNTAVVNSPPQLLVSIQVLTEVATHGGNEGSAQALASGGAPPYNFLWSNGSNNNTATGLQAGATSVTVTDANGCSTSAVVTLIQPSKIGNFVWNDLNQNGIQNLGEPGIGGVTVFLSGVNSAGDTIDLTTTTDTSGFYAFDGLRGGFYMVSFELLLNHVFTYSNIGNDALDSDPDPTTGNTQGFNVSQGQYDSRWDAGMIFLDEKIDIGDKVWYDTNHDGIQDPLEAGVEGVVVRLRKMPNNNIIAIDVTDIVGNYLFEDVLPGEYRVEFSLASFPPGGYIVSPKDQGTDDTKDSDANVATGITDVFTVFPFTLDNLTIDMGIYRECDNATDGGLIGYDEDLCGVGADPAEIVNLAFPTGGYGVIEYLWMRSNIPVFNGPGDPNWSMIPNSNSPNYDPGPISQSTYYIRCARRQGCADYLAESNVVAKKVTPYPLAQIIDAPGIMCRNQEGRFEAAIAGAGATYYWQFGGGGDPATATTRVVTGVKWATSGPKTVSLTVTRFGCSFTVTATVIIDNCTYQPLIIFNDMFAQTVGESIRVEWKVTGNTDNTVFFVQTSEDGTGYQTIGNLMAQPGIGEATYHFMHDQPRFGKNHYRIMYEKLDGANLKGYSPIAEAMFQRSATENAQVFPNPTTGWITVELLEPTNEPAHVEIWTTYGQLVRLVEIPANVEKHSIDLTNEVDGAYLVKVKQNKLKAQICRVFKGK